MQGIYEMRKLSKFSLLFVLLFSAIVAVSAQESDQDWKKEPSQETPEQAKKEAQKLDTKASAGDLARAVHNSVASLISVPVQNCTDFNIGPFGRDRNAVLQFQPVVPIQLSQNWTSSPAPSGHSSISLPSLNRIRERCGKLAMD
jgi:hypothetical protein